MTAAAATAAGYTLAAGPVCADVIKTDAVGLTVGDAKIAVSGGEMPVYFAKPDGVRNPPVILVAMEVFGLHEYIKDVVRRLAKLGAFAIAPDYYFRKGVDLTKITTFRSFCRSSTPSRTLSFFPISTARWPGPRRKAATPIVSGSSVFAVAGARCGNMPRIRPR